MASSPMIHEATTTRKAHAIETRYERNRRVTLEALRAGVRVECALGTRTYVWSGRSKHNYEVHLLEDGAVETWVCDDHCTWFTRHGELEVYNSGTTMQSKNDVLPCAHVLIARLWHMGAVQREDLFSDDAELGAAWAQAHAGEIV